MARERSADISARADTRALTILTGVIARRITPGILRTFLAHALTKAERAVLLRRVEIAVRLSAGQSYRMVQDALGVSPNLTRRVDRWLEAERPGYRRLVPLRFRRHWQKKRRNAGGEHRGHFPGSFDAFLARFPLWRGL